MSTQEPGLAVAFAELTREVNALYQLVARRFGLTVQQVELLCLLGGGRPPSSGELAAALGCDKTNVTGLVDRLVRRGLLDRATDPGDRRVTRILVTEKGRETGTAIRDALDHELTTRLPAAGRSHLIALLRESASALAGTRPNG